MRFVAALAFALLAGVIATHAQLQTVPYKANLRLHPFNTLPVPNYALVDGATVSVEAGFASGYDQLLLDYIGAFPITQQFDGFRGILYLTGTATISEYLSAIQSVVFVTSAEDGAARRITWSLGNATIYNSLTQHFYKWSFLGAQSPSAANDVCNSTWFGMQGYLATITSDDEMQIVGSKNSVPALVGGANTDAMQNIWKWTYGPEAGWPFWQGGSVYLGGMPSNAWAFNAWGRFEPLNYSKPAFDVTNDAIFMTLTPSAYEPVSTWQSRAVTSLGGFICEYGGMETNPAVVNTAMMYGGAIILEFDCKQFDNAFDCGNNKPLGCSWSGTQCTSSQCGQYFTEKDCDGNNRCMWSTSSLIGQCVPTVCGQYVSAAACQADSRCTPQTSVDNVPSCVAARCSDYTQACQCAKQSSCMWRDGACAFSAAMGCNGMDIVFLMDATWAMAQPFQTWTSGFWGLTDLFLSFQYGLTRTGAGQSIAGASGARIGFVQFNKDATVTPSGIGSSGRLTGAWGDVQSDLQFHQRAFSGNVAARKVGPALQAAKAMFDSQSSTRNKIVVVLAAGGIDDAADLAQQFSSNSQSGNPIADLKSMGVKLFGVALQSTMPRTLWSNAAASSLSWITGSASLVQQSPLGWLNNIAVNGLCWKSSTFGAVALAGSTAPVVASCASYASWDACVGDSLCAWSYSAMSCVASQCVRACGSSCPATTCVVAAGTSGVSQCREVCATQTSMTGCQNNNVACWWNATNSRCYPKPCVSNPTEDACIADPALCSFNASWAVKCQPTPCQTNDPVQCASMTFGSQRCIFSTGSSQCVLDVCSGLSQSNCGNSASCMWSNDNNKCVTNDCGGYSAEADCARRVLCKWDTSVSTPRCIAAPCSQIASSTTCNLKAGCQWQNVDSSGLCVVKTCEMQLTAASCATMANASATTSACVWRNNQCLDNRFVQCPGIDVLFVVEGTPAMQNDFGRHPNGFAGVMEAIRSWGRKAPFAATGSGFRASIILYGGTGASMTSNAGQLLANQSSFVGPSGEIEQSELNQPNYETYGQVNILPALTQASTTFGNPSSATRSKMLIIIGASTITDGTSINSNGQSALRAQIKTLEAQGVQIFTNVLTRFSTITAWDQAVAGYLSPLASSPASAHFQFINIDNLGKNLLDSFCDPTSNTGAYLGVTRDSVVPCAWLDGQTECNMQPSCAYQTNAVPQCPIAGQCANLNCQALSDELVAAGFSCLNCKLVNGAFSCDFGQTYLPKKQGVCLPSSCTLNTQAACTGSCMFNANSQACVVNVCGGLAETACNQNLGCVYDEPAAMCRPSKCWNARSTMSCGEVPSAVATCNWVMPPVLTAPPSVCVESRCANFQNPSCTAPNSGCQWIGSSSKCLDRLCTYQTAETCEADTGCFWNHFVSSNQCQVRSVDCILTPFTPWTPCSATCGTAKRYKTRQVAQYPGPNGQSCDAVASVQCNTQEPNCNVGDFGMVVSEVCTGLTPCTTYCATLTANLQACVNDISCQWSSGACVPKPQSGCGLLTTAQSCNASDMCSWSNLYSFCVETVKTCKFNTQADCSAASALCAWRSGQSTISAASQQMVEPILINPGQPPVSVFPATQINVPGTINGATIVIESGYQRGKDVLSVAIPVPGITAEWIVQSGSLLLHGAASFAAYATAISAVTFQTFSTVTAARSITWTFGNNTMYSVATGNFYKKVVSNSPTGVSFTDAQVACSGMSFYGIQGYLATVGSAEENSVISTKLGGEGWLGGAERLPNQWSWVTGPDVSNFWNGGSSLTGNFVVPTMYANWNPVSGEPVPGTASSGSNRVYMNISGYWSSKSFSYGGAGFVCEFSGEPSMTVSGSAIIGIGGCVANTCVWHATAALCNNDAECRWSNASQSCRQGCNSRSTLQSCLVAAPECVWDTTLLPPMCDINICTSMGSVACAASSRCVWNPALGCVYKTGCASIMDQASCATPCAWRTLNGRGYCDQQQCNELSATQCGNNAACILSQGSCQSALCRFTTASDCQANQACTWSAGNAAVPGFLPGGSAIFPFTTGTVSPQTMPNQIVDGATVSITVGFIQNNDQLDVESTNSGMYSTTYDPLRGTLVITAAPGTQVTAMTMYQYLIANVKFWTTSKSTTPRTFSYTLGINMYTSASTGKNFRYYGMSTFNNFADASAFCSTQWFFGAQGGLAYISNEVDDSGVAALNAQGWIGAVGIAGSWSWAQNATGSAQTFWQITNGLGSPVASTNGSPLFSHWGAGEPRFSTGTVFGFMLPSQSNGLKQDASAWTAVSNGQTLPGVICQFAANTAPASFTRQAAATGCFPAPCIGLTQTACQGTAICRWDNGINAGNTAQCVYDQWCSQRTNSSDCNLAESCNWDGFKGQCVRVAATICTGLPQLGCTGQCQWNTQVTNERTLSSGACIPRGCSYKSVASACVADSNCMWNGALCFSRNCGYPAESDCWKDNRCMWNTNQSRCVVSPCGDATAASQTTCQATDSCQWNATMNQCLYKRCGTTKDRPTCQADPQCLWENNACSMPGCNQYVKETDCNSNPKCIFMVRSTVLNSKCEAAQCLSITKQTDCTGLCSWDDKTTTCKNLPSDKQGIVLASTGLKTCDIEVTGPLWWLWLMIAVIAILLIEICRRLYLAHAKGLSFFEPVRKNVKYSPHQQYAADLFEEAKNTGAETNVASSYKPGLNDL